MNQTFIVLETFDIQYPNIVTDENGFPLIFDNIEEAQSEADECQKGLVVLLP